jgi:cyclophilin family peptidyl-prolyl cis-trans isomerase
MCEPALGSDLQTRGPPSARSQFFLTFKTCAHLDGKHVVFGKLTAGWSVLEAIELLGSESGTPSSRVVRA